MQKDGGGEVAMGMGITVGVLHDEANKSQVYDSFSCLLRSPLARYSCPFRSIPAASTSSLQTPRASMFYPFAGSSSLKLLSICYNIVPIVSRQKK
jgi:hypothetical protein